MVTQVTNFGRSGLSDWVVQRVSGVILLAYTIVIAVVLLWCSPDYAAWKGLFDQTWMKVFSVAAILSVAAHAWIGLWCVSTDYLVKHVLTIKLGPAVGAKANVLRWAFQAASAIVLFTYVVWGIQILWG
ncbi:succinate dehydrogenase, hydrophobic membrane anchor protein [Oceanicoccus sp. KOV_DT_Chl]|uniref:succinate dehydrogenase, hydrophobic membrane anchor protein n=1 Tax=Oceanicoccus sp. KOV_DT_Chl TaxID=1904639 RepID=UPI000C7DB256|nr:succinate dehydrogenase, hydrophobic membrane anchor protein [Oceanicoccus sp. KOV_DT_Chl]